MDKFDLYSDALWSCTLTTLTEQMRIIADKISSDTHLSSTISLDNFEPRLLCSIYVTMLSSQVPGLPRRLLSRALKVTIILDKLSNTSFCTIFPPVTFMFHKESKNKLVSYQTYPKGKHHFLVTKYLVAQIHYSLPSFVSITTKYYSFPRP